MNHHEEPKGISYHDRMMTSHVDLEGYKTHLEPLDGQDKEQVNIHHEKYTKMEARRKAWPNNMSMKFYIINAKSWIVLVSSRSHMCQCIFPHHF